MLSSVFDIISTGLKEISHEANVPPPFPGREGLGFNVAKLMIHSSYHITKTEKEIWKRIETLFFSHCIIKCFTSSLPKFLIPHHYIYGLNINLDVFIVFDI